MTYRADDLHLAALLEGARASLADTSLRGRRLTGFQILDFYLATLNETASLLRLPVGAEKVGELVDSVIAGLPHLRHVDHLKGLREFRNRLYHNELHSPSHERLARYIDSAEATRKALREGADDVVRRRATMSEIGARLTQAASELERMLPQYGEPVKSVWTAKAARARTLAETHNEGGGIEGVDLYAEIRAHISAVRTEEEILSPVHYEPEPPYEDYDPEPPEWDPPWHNDPEEDPDEPEGAHQDRPDDAGPESADEKN